MNDTETSRATDLDERLESCLRLAAQMHALAGLYQGVVHDLKSPLNAMVVNLELMRSSLDPEAPNADKQQRYARVLHDEMMRLDRSIERLLPASAPLRDVPERFDLRDVAGEVAAFVGPQARKQSVTVTPPGEVKGAPPLPITGHRDRVKQALLAVAINALEAMPDGGTLAIEATADEPSGSDAEGPRGRVAVTDTGPGISEDRADRIYDLYFSTKPGHDGIGLYVARQVVKSTDGTIELSPSPESTPEEGSRFEISFPLCD